MGWAGARGAAAGILLACLLLGTPGAARGRSLLQQNASSTTVVLTEGNVTQIADEIAGLADGSVVVLDVEGFTLEGPLEIGVNLTIRGASPEARPVIRCGAKNRRGDRLEKALIATADITMEDLVIKQCGDPAVTLRPGEDQDPGTVLSAMFRRVAIEDTVFLGERPERVGSDILSGGAIGAVSGFNINVESCSFTNNTAASGAAMSVIGSNLTVVNSTFVGNRLASGAVGEGAAINIKESNPPRGSFLAVEGCNFSNNIDPNGASDNEPLVAASAFGSPLEATQFIRFDPPLVSGGALSAAGLSSVRVTGSRFGRNRATPAGGAMTVLEAGELEVLDCDFFDNEARANDSDGSGMTRRAQGGALYIQLKSAESGFILERSNFTNNSAGYGGAVHFVGHAEVKMSVETARFEGNWARFGGGAMVVRNARSEFEKTIFRNNVGGFGGAIMLANAAWLSLIGRCSREDMRLTGNVAVTGGAVAARGAGLMQVSDVVFADNHALESGGAIALVEGTITTQLTLENPQVLNSSAARGGGLFVDSIGRLNIKMGGQCDRSVFATNIAEHGGGLLIRAQSRTKNDIDFSRVNFVGNAAVLDIKSTDLVRRRQADYLRSVVGEENFEALLTVAAKRVARLQVLQSRGEVSLETIVAENGASGGFDRLRSGGGGGAQLELDQGTAQGGVNANLRGIRFERNFGKLGGGLMAIVDGVGWKPSCESSATACRSFFLENVTFAQDGALSTAGGLFASNPRNVYVDVEDQNLVDFFMARNASAPIEAPTGFFNNSVNSGGFGVDSASFASHLVLKSPGVTNVTTEDGRTVLLLDMGRLNHNSTDPLPPFVLEVKDSFNQTITSGTNDAGLIVEAMSGNATANGTVGDVLSGARIAQAVRGVVNFTDAFARAQAGNYTLQFAAQQPQGKMDVSSLVYQFTIRECLVGEFPEDVICIPCRQGFFSFDPTESCAACPSHANCPGGAALVPDTGYWHSTPFSPEIHKCLLIDACRFDEREKDLRGFFSNLTNSGSSTLRTDVMEAEYQQCAEGYEGILCGTCSEGFGHIESRCDMCDDAKLQKLYIFLVFLWSLALLCVTIRSAVAAGIDMRELHSFLEKQSGAVNGASVQDATRDQRPNGNTLDGVRLSSKSCGLPQRTATYSAGGLMSHASYASSGIETDAGSIASPRSPHSARSQSMASRQVARELERQFGQPDLRSYSMAPLKRISIIGRQTPREPSGDKIDRSTEGPQNAEESKPAVPESFKAIRHIVAAEFLSETLKIGTNFLQVTSFALAINSNWTKTVRNLLGVQDVLAGFSGGSSLLSIECAMPADPLPRTVSAALVIVFTPFILMAFVQLCFLVYWLHEKHSHNRPFSVFISNAILTAITAIFFAYSSVTEELMKMVNCVPLDEGVTDLDLEIPTQYSNFSTAQDTFWVEDTSQRCFKNEHMYLAYFVGIPGIVLFTLGIPISLYAFLMTKKAELYEPEYLKTYGFVYEAYAENHVYWECLTMARKGLIATIVVFGYKLGPNLQAVLALGVLIVALILHVVVQPYKFDQLNELEGASLVVTMLTIYSGLVFQDNNTSVGGRAAMSAVVLTFNICFVLILLFELYRNLNLYSDAKIHHYGGTVRDGQLLPVKLFLVGFYMVKQKVTATMPEEKGKVATVKRMIARKMGWQLPKAETRRPLPQEHVDGRPVGGMEQISTISEEKSSEIYNALELSREDWKQRAPAEDPIPESTVVDMSPTHSVGSDESPSSSSGRPAGAKHEDYYSPRKE